MSSETGSTQVENDPSSVPKAILSAVFSDTTPRHVVEGVAAGVVETVKGVAVGAGVLGMSIYACAQQREASSIVSGVASGLLGFVGLSLYGAGCGVKKVVQGTLNTSQTIGAVIEGDRLWSEESATYVEVKLSELERTLPATDEDIFNEARMRWLGSQKEHNEAQETNTDNMAYYSLLGVSKSATRQDIKKAYTAKALVLHPDKNPDPHSSKEFQRVSEAYRVLSDTVLRAQYDAGELREVGSRSHLEVNGNTQSEWGPVEEVLMWRQFAPWVGRPRYLLMLHPSMRFDSTSMKVYESRKCLRAALHLLSVVDRQHGFADAEASIEDMCSCSVFGCDVVELIVESYESVLRQFAQQDAFLRGADAMFWNAVSSVSHAATMVATVGRTAFRAYYRTMEEAHVHAILLAACSNEIRHVATTSAFMLLADKDATKDVRQQRAQQLNSIVSLMKSTVERHRAPQPLLH